jgi:hypothetical protein
MEARRSNPGARRLMLGLLVASALFLAVEVHLLGLLSARLVARFGPTGQLAISLAILLASFWLIRWLWVACLSLYNNRVQRLHPQTDRKRRDDGDAD